MNKTNVFCSTEFDMQTGDVLHLLFIDESGDPFNFELSAPDEEDGPPSAPTALPATSLTASTFTANWYYNQSTDGYYLDVALDEDFTEFVPGFEDLDVGNVDHYHMTGLSPSMVYYYRIRAYNDYGTSDNSNVITAYTTIDLTLGALYNQSAVATGKLLPAGWHVWTRAEVLAITSLLGGEFVTGGKLKETGTVYFNTPNTGASNSTGFNGRGTGVRNQDALFTNRMVVGQFWTSTHNSGDYYFAPILMYNSASFPMLGYLKQNGFSIRGVKDDSIDPGSVFDIDGNEYATITIGTYVLMAENLRTTHYNDGADIPVITDDALWMADTTGAMCWYNNITP